MSLLNADELSNKMETALDILYKERFDRALPGGGREERKMLLLAISRGILDYLAEKQVDIINSITLKKILTGRETTYNVENLVLNIETAGGL